MSSTTSLPLSSIIAQPDTFQMRDNAYSQETVDKIVAGFDPRLLDPLQVFKNASGQYVIAGDSHSRFEALKRLAASGGAPGIDLSAVPVNIVDESTAHTLALRGNTKSTAYRPMELAKVFGEEQKRDSSLTVRDIARIHSKTVSSVNQHLALNALPAAAQDAVRMNTLSPEVGGVFGSFIQNNSIAREDATAIYERFIRPNDFTKNGLDTALQTLLRIPKTEQMGMGGMFGDESGGGENYAQALTDIAVKKQELDIKKRALASISNAIKKVPGSSAVDQPKLQEEITSANAEIVSLQESLGAGVSPSTRAASKPRTKEQEEDREIRSTRKRLKDLVKKVADERKAKRGDNPASKERGRFLSLLTQKQGESPDGLVGDARLAFGPEPKGGGKGRGGSGGGADNDGRLTRSLLAQMIRGAAGDLTANLDSEGNPDKSQDLAGLKAGLIQRLDEGGFQDAAAQISDPNYLLDQKFVNDILSPKGKTAEQQRAANRAEKARKRTEITESLGENIRRAGNGHREDTKDFGYVSALNDEFEKAGVADFNTRRRFNAAKKAEDARVKAAQVKADKEIAAAQAKAEKEAADAQKKAEDAQLADVSRRKKRQAEIRDNNHANLKLQGREAEIGTYANDEDINLDILKDDVATADSEKSINARRIAEGKRVESEQKANSPAQLAAKELARRNAAQKELREHNSQGLKQNNRTSEITSLANYELLNSQYLSNDIDTEMSNRHIVLRRKVDAERKAREAKITDPLGVVTARRADITRDFQNELIQRGDRDFKSNSNLTELKSRLRAANVDFPSDGPAPTKLVKPKRVPGAAKVPGAPQGPLSDGEELMRRRRELAKEQHDRHAADPKLRPKMGGQKYQDELRKTFKREKVDTAEDSPGGKLGLGAAVAGYRFVRAIEQTIGTGGLVSSAVGSLVKGLAAGVVAASGGIIAVGETLLGFVLSPFGKSGQAIGNAAQSLGKALMSGLQAGGSLASGVLQLTYGLQAALTAAMWTLGAAAAGALFGAIFGGGLAGGLAGAGLGAMIAGTLLQGLGQVVSQISGVVGSALSAIGTALGEVGKSASELLKSIATLLSDLIATGTKFSQAAIGNSLMGGMSASAGLTSASLAQVLTGSANGLSSFYGNISNSSPYLASKQAAFGIKGVNASDPTSMLMPGYNRFQELGHGPDGAIQQRIMMQSVYGGAASSMMQLFTAGPDSIRELIRVVKENQLTPKESANNEVLQVDMRGIEMKADKIKMKMLSMFMPLIESVFPALEKGMTTFGDFMKNKFLIYLRLGSDYMFAFGQTLAESLPKVFLFVEKMLMGLIVMAKNLAGMIAPLVAMKSPALGKALTEFSNAPLSSFGLGIKKEGTVQTGKDAEATQASIDGYKSTLQQITDKSGSYGAMTDSMRQGLQMKYQALLKASQDKLAHGVNAETDDDDIANADQLPYNKTVNDWSKKLGSKLTDGQAEVNSRLDPIIGTTPEQKTLLDAAERLRAQALEVQKAMDDPLRDKTDDDTGKLKQMAEERDALNAAAKVKSDQAYNSMLKNSGASRDNTYRTTGGGNSDNHTVLDVNINYDKDGLINVKHEFSKQSAQQLVRAMQHSN